MSFSIDTAFVEQFKSNVTMLSQQKGSKLESLVMNEGVTGDTAYFEQIGPTVTQTRTTRHGDSPLVSTPHSRRVVHLDSEEWGDLVDDADKVRMLIDPTSSYAMNAAWAFGRTKDDKIIAAATGTAYTGHTGSTAVALPSGQKVAVNHGGSSEGLTVDKLIAAAEIFGENDVDEDEERVIVVSQKQISDLLAITEIKSADYNTVKALVQGKVDTYMGFRFVRTQRLALNTSTDVRTCFCFVRSGIALGVGRQPVGRIQERADKAFSTYVYMAMDVGAARLEEEKVVEVLCDESP